MPACRPLKPAANKTSSLSDPTKPNVGDQRAIAASSTPQSGGEKAKIKFLSHSAAESGGNHERFDEGEHLDEALEENWIHIGGASRLSWRRSGSRRSVAAATAVGEPRLGFHHRIGGGARLALPLRHSTPQQQREAEVEDSSVVVGRVCSDSSGETPQNPSVRNYRKCHFAEAGDSV